MTKIGWSITSPSEVSTHMPLARHDKSMERSGGYIQFLLTCLLRGMTLGVMDGYIFPKVSTHMPLARHDLYWDLLAREILAFLLTCLLRGMTVIRGKNAVNIIVSTHMPLARHDKILSSVFFILYRFYSHASCEA